MNCTWKGCSAVAAHPQLDKHQQEWANLCNDHHRALNDALGSTDAKQIIRAWAHAKSDESRKRDASEIAARLAKLAKILLKEPK